MAVADTLQAVVDADSTAAREISEFGLRKTFVLLRWMAAWKLLSKDLVLES